MNSSRTSLPNSVPLSVYTKLKIMNIQKEKISLLGKRAVHTPSQHVGNITGVVFYQEEEPQVWIEGKGGWVSAKEVELLVEERDKE